MRLHEIEYNWEPTQLEHNNMSDGGYVFVISKESVPRWGASDVMLKLMHDNRIVWEDLTYGYSGDSFSSIALSSIYGNAILLKNTMYKTQPIYINMITGNEHHLDNIDNYSLSGHFYSFNGCFYYKDCENDFVCLNFDTNERFKLKERLLILGIDVIKWSVCNIRNCIVVVTNTYERNLLLVDIIKLKVIDQCTISLINGTSYNVFLRFDSTQNLSVVGVYNEASGITNNYSISFE